MTMTSITSDQVRAIAVLPGQRDSLHLTTIALPPPGPHEARVRVHRVGICGTDKEIIEAKFGSPPPGSRSLIIGHEVLGVVEETGTEIATVSTGDLVVATVRRPDGCPACQAGQPDMCVWRGYTERGIIGAHGFMAEAFVDDARHLVPIEPSLEPVAVLVEPLSVVEKAVRQANLIQRRLTSWSPHTALVLGAGPIGLLGAMLLRSRGIAVTVVARRPAPTPASLLIETCGGHYASLSDRSLAELAASTPPFDLILEATGVSTLAFEGLSLVANNGVMVLLSITGGQTVAQLPVDTINREMVLGNKVVVGSVNSAHEDFVNGVADLARFDALWPGATARLITHRLHAFDDVTQMHDATKDGIKTVVEFPPR